MSQVIHRLSESLRSLAGRGASLVIPEKAYGGRVYPDPTFEKMNDVHIGDSDIGSSIQFISDVAVGNGFEVTMNEDYKQTVISGEYYGLTAVELIREKCDFFGMDELTQEITKDLVGYGNSILWQKNPVKIETLARILPGTIKEFKFDDESGLILEYVKTSKASFPADELIPFMYNRIGKTAIGVGILQALCTALKLKKGGSRPPMAEIKNRIQKSMMEQIEKFSAYNELWILPGVSDKKLSTYHSKIQKLYNARMVFNKPDAKVIQLVPERMRGLDFYAETLWNSFYLALGTAYPKLVLGGAGGFTEAAANAAVAMGERRIAALQRFEKRMIETFIFDKWVAEEGLDPIKAQVRLNWQIIDKPKMETLLPMLEKTWELKGITTPEWRDVLIKCGVNLKSAELPAETDGRK